jgi:probable rRNA maturation factor
MSRAPAKPGLTRPGLTRPGLAASAIDIMVQAPLWATQRGVKATVRRAILEAALATSTSAGELAIVLTDDSAIRSLNHNWRRKDTPTNVLSFPARRNGRETPRHLGDIVIAYQTTAREAEAERKPFLHHLAHLAVHGFLHLIGYDHETDDEAEVMENLEISVLARLRVPNPYVARESLG